MTAEQETPPPVPVDRYGPIADAWLARMIEIQRQRETRPARSFDDLLSDWPD